MKWGPIDTAPQDGRFVLLFDPDPNIQEFWIAQYDDGRWWIQDREYTAYAPTHWMPLPEPPK